MSDTSERLRREWAVNDAKRDAGLITPDDIERFDNIPYGSEPKWNELDVYRPRGSSLRLPVIVVVHGGGWVYGDKELYQFYGMSLAERGFAVVNYSYRLAPEHKFPASLEDTNSVIGWMFDNREIYGFDMSHVFMVGDSAGGHMAALYASICTNKAYAQNYPFSVPNNFVPTALGLNCGAYVPLRENAAEDDNDKDLMGDLLPGKGTPEEAFLIDATKHITEDFPPAFVMSSTGDFCLHQVPAMVKELCENRIPFVCKVYGDKRDPLYHVFHVNVRESIGQKCNDEECAFFRTFCLEGEN